MLHESTKPPSEPACFLVCLQSIISDAICTAAVGRPAYPSALMSCKRNTKFAAPNGINLEYSKAREKVSVDIIAQS
jgi:hypothetical protein